MAKQTSANMQPCKGNGAERHNRRDKEMAHVRSDLTPLNIYKEWIPFDAQMKIIRTEYKKATGQKLQPNAHPIKEIVLVTDKNTTPAQVERFCDLIKELGMTPLSYAIHKDEGHPDPKTGEWVPNYHAHIIVDTTCWTHKEVTRRKKSNGKTVLDQETGKPCMIKGDAYARIIRFSRRDLATLQDFAAKATGLERGIPSGRVHEETRRYKARAQARDIQEQAARIIEQEKQLVVNEETIRACIRQLQDQSKEIIASFDQRKKDLSDAEIEIDDGILEQRDRLAALSGEDLTNLPILDLVQRFAPLTSTTHVVAMASVAMASMLYHMLGKNIQEDRQARSRIMMQIKTLSTWCSAKSAINAILNKPSTRQVETALRDKAQAEKEIASLKQKITDLEKDRDEQDQTIVILNHKLNHVSWENGSLRKENETLKDNLSKKDQDIRRLGARIKGHENTVQRISETLVDFATPEQLEQYEWQGIPALIGEDIWIEAKRTIPSRKAMRAYQTRLHGRNENMEPKGRGQSPNPTMRKPPKG